MRAEPARLARRSVQLVSRMQTSKSELGSRCRTRVYVRGKVQAHVGRMRAQSRVHACNSPTRGRSWAPMVSSGFAARSRMRHAALLHGFLVSVSTLLAFSCVEDEGDTPPTTGGGPAIIGDASWLDATQPATPG